MFSANMISVLLMFWLKQNCQRLQVACRNQRVRLPQIRDFEWRCGSVPPTSLPRASLGQSAESRAGTAPQKSEAGGRAVGTLFESLWPPPQQKTHKALPQASLVQIVDSLPKCCWIASIGNPFARCGTYLATFCQIGCSGSVGFLQRPRIWRAEEKGYGFAEFEIRNRSVSAAFQPLERCPLTTRCACPFASLTLEILDDASQLR